MNEKVKIHSENIKLDQFLKWSGITQTGGEAKQTVAEGRVLVNGEKCLQRGKKLRVGDKVEFNGKTIEIC